MAIEARAMRIAGIPALAVYDGNMETAAESGTILYYHGFGGTKDEARAPLSVLAAAGFLGVGFDNAGHGERRLPDFERRFDEDLPRHEFEANLVALVRETVREIPAAIDDLLDRGLAKPGAIGIAGWSFGGYVAYAAVAADKRLVAAAPMVASPEWGPNYPDSPHRHPEHFYPAALLSQLAGDDRSVPPDAGCRFHDMLAPRYAGNPERLRYHVYPGVGHEVPQAVTDVIWRRMADWFELYLT